MRIEPLNCSSRRESAQSSQPRIWSGLTSAATRLLLIALLLSTVSLSAADFTLKTTDKEVPKEVGESMRAVLQGKAFQLLQGDKPALEIWLRQELPLKSKPASPSEALASIASETLVA